MNKGLYLCFNLKTILFNFLKLVFFLLQSLTRAVMNIAQLLGPLVGGAIYQAGGFYLPFVTMGALQFIVGIISIFFLPQPSNSKSFLM